MLALSPDDRFLTYASNESDLFELYITPFPACDRRWRVNSARQAFWPVWRKIGEQLFLYFCDYDGAIYELPVSTERDSLRLGQPQHLFSRRIDGQRNEHQDWPPGFDVSADGQEFLVFDVPEGIQHETFLTMVQNFGSMLSAKTGSASIPVGESK